MGIATPRDVTRMVGRLRRAAPGLALEFLLARSGIRASRDELQWLLAALREGARSGQAPLDAERLAALYRRGPGRSMRAPASSGD